MFFSLTTNNTNNISYSGAEQSQIKNIFLVALQILYFALQRLNHDFSSFRGSAKFILHDNMYAHIYIMYIQRVDAFLF